MRGMQTRTNRNGPMILLLHACFVFLTWRGGLGLTLGCFFWNGALTDSFLCVAGLAGTLGGGANGGGGRNDGGGERRDRWPCKQKAFSGAHRGCQRRPYLRGRCRRLLRHAVCFNVTGISGPFTGSPGLEHYTLLLLLLVTPFGQPRRERSLLLLLLLLLEAALLWVKLLLLLLSSGIVPTGVVHCLTHAKVVIGLRQRGFGWKE